MKMIISLVLFMTLNILWGKSQATKLNEIIPLRISGYWTKTILGERLCICVEGEKILDPFQSGMD